MHYRNLADTTLKFAPGLTSIVGSNAQGKSNLLEAIFLALSGTLDVSRIETVIAFENPQAFVRAEIERDDGISKLEIGLASGKRIVRVDGTRVRTGELARHAACVLIRPEDSELVHGSPSHRRAFLDTLVARLSPRYAQALESYERTLSQRNAALKQKQISGLEIWDAKLAQLGAEIMRYRRRAVTKLGELTSQSYTELAGTQNQKTLSLEIFESAPIEDFENALLLRRNEELARGSTSIGPHRDDLHLKLNGRNAQEFASRGEARTIALALRKGEFDVLNEKFGEAPVLLIDDFSAELDSERRSFLLDLAENTPQAIVTGTETPDWKAKKIYRFNIRAGHISRDTENGATRDAENVMRTTENTNE